MDNIGRAKEVVIMDKFESVRVLKSKTVYNKQGRQVVEDTLNLPTVQNMSGSISRAVER
jgi:hypothetical protein